MKLAFYPNVTRDILRIPFGMYTHSVDLLEIDSEFFRCKVKGFNKFEDVKNFIDYVLNKIPEEQLYNEFKLYTHNAYYVDYCTDLESKIYNKFISVIKIPPGVIISRLNMFKCRVEIRETVSYTFCYIQKSPKHIDEQLQTMFTFAGEL